MTRLFFVVPKKKTDYRTGLREALGDEGTAKKKPSQVGRTYEMDH